MTKRDLDILAELLPKLSVRLADRSKGNVIIYRGEMRAVAALIRERIDATAEAPEGEIL